VNAGRRAIVGVNRFTEGNDDDPIPILQITHEDEARQIKRLNEVRQQRGDAAVRAALDDLARVAADPEANLMPTLIDTVRTYASLGEVMSTLAGVFGRHVETPSI
jgi:methylmalonyl-CoA mutase N-terminal domain/subunit